MMHVTGYEHYVKDSAIQMFTQRVVEITDQQCPRLSNYSLIDSANGSYGSPDTSNTNVQDYQSIVATILQIEATGRLTPAYLHGYYQRGLTLEPICFILIMFVYQATGKLQKAGLRKNGLTQHQLAFIAAGS